MSLSVQELEDHARAYDDGCHDPIQYCDRQGAARVHLMDGRGSDEGRSLTLAVLIGLAGNERV